MQQYHQISYKQDADHIWFSINRAERKIYLEGRFTWRHNSVLDHFVTTIKEKIAQSLELFPDIPNFWLNGATIPPDILQTGSRPDLVFINRAERKICFLELTCSFKYNIQMANIQKAKKSWKGRLECCTNSIQHQVPRFGEKTKLIINNKS